ncbi:ABC transporter ATP-binding protein [Prevotella sp. HUN102]|uniref:ABC transporter ATP-binding protein n=1 Tax=Prevotella sp. HUN102 TaxID=1392486 RepID=UPI00048E4C93|nr:ABC transporter ATP-binding protein [Prevotella sp. HUN102]
MEIRIENLKKIYGEKTVIDIPELALNQGELVGLVGNNGAGKTTLMRLMLDLIKADGGRVLSNGNQVDEDEAWKKYTGSFIDKSFLIDYYTPEEFFDFIGNVYGIDADTITGRLSQFESLMRDEIIGTGKYIRNFSEGNRQKIGIIAAMIINPDFLILDEPFNYLDPSSQITIAKLIQKINKELGTTVLLSSHNLNFVSEISTRIILMEKGIVLRDISNVDGSAEKELQEYFEGTE